MAHDLRDGVIGLVLLLSGFRHRAGAVGADDHDRGERAALQQLENSALPLALVDRRRFASVSRFRGNHSSHAGRHLDGANRADRTFLFWREAAPIHLFPLLKAVHE